MTDQTQARHLVRMPGTVKLAVAGLWLLTLVYAFGAVTVFLEAKSMVDHGQEGAAAPAAGGVMVSLVVLLQALCAVVALRGQRWARWTAVALMGFLLLSGLVGLLLAALVAQDPLGIAVTGGLTLASGGTGALLLSRPAAEWFVR